MNVRYVVLGTVALFGCSPAIRCGEGTVLRDGVCIAAIDGAVADVSIDVSAADHATPVDGALSDTPGVDAATDAFAVDSPSLDVATLDTFTPDVAFDAGFPDVPIIDAGPLDIRIDDTLLVTPVMATILPGHLLCPSFTLLRADGTRVPVLPGSAMATVTPNDTSVLAVADPTDCGPLGGVLALAPRSTTARWTLMSAGASISAVLPVTIADGRITLSTSLDLILPVGGSHDYQMYVRYPLTAGGSATPSREAQLVPRWFTGPQGTPSTLLDPIAPPDASLLLHPRGASIGTGHITGAYGPPGASVPIVSTGTITVVAPGTLTEVGPIYYYRDGLFASQGAPSAMAPGDCLEMRVRGGFSSPSGTAYEQVLDPSAITWTVTGDGHLDIGPPTMICATARGEITVRACSMGVCGTETIPVLVAGETTTVTLAPSDIIFTQTILGAFGGCVPIRATLDYADSSTRDVTNSPATSWLVPFMGAMSVNLFRSTSGGMLQVDASGNPCFTAAGPASRSYDITLSASYGGIHSTNSIAVHVR